MIYPDEYNKIVMGANMKGDFQFFITRTFNDSLNIEDIGETFIETSNDLYQRYFLGIKTVMGITRVLSFGPVEEGYPTNFTSSFYQFDYDEKKIPKLIDRFLNDPKKQITQAIEISEESFKEYLQDGSMFFYDNE